MILAGKIICLMLVALFSPSMLIGGLRGQAVEALSVVLVACGTVGFITLQWLL